MLQIINRFLNFIGESALHIAIIFGSVEAVKVLIENGANINERASGRFFLPEDQKKGRTKDTDYEGLYLTISICCISS